MKKFLSRQHCSQTSLGYWGRKRKQPLHPAILPWGWTTRGSSKTSEPPWADLWVFLCAWQCFILLYSPLLEQSRGCIFLHVLFFVCFPAAGLCFSRCHTLQSAPKAKTWPWERLGVDWGEKKSQCPLPSLCSCAWWCSSLDHCWDFVAGMHTNLYFYIYLYICKHIDAHRIKLHIYKYRCICRINISIHYRYIIIIIIIKKIYFCLPGQLEMLDFKFPALCVSLPCLPGAVGWPWMLCPCAHEQPQLMLPGRRWERRGGVFFLAMSGQWTIGQILKEYPRRSLETPGSLQRVWGSLGRIWDHSTPPGNGILGWPCSADCGR